MIYVTSDPHFCHDKDFVYERRGFKTIEEMNEAIISRFNSIVTPEDTLYILGDCALKDTETGIKCLKRLNGHKYLAIGNHDSDKRIERFYEEKIFDKIEIGYRIKYGKYSLWLTHYPMLMGNYKDKHPTWNLSGHTHKTDPFDNGKDGIYNVSVDAHDCYPCDLEFVIQEIDEFRAKVKAEEEIYNQLIPCDKCVKELQCANAHTRQATRCKDFKRDPPDGGYYG